MARKISTKGLKKRAWDLCSLYIRKKYANADGSGTCVSCGVKKNLTGKGCIQAGHLVPSRRLGILFDERGIFPQCYACNVIKKGNAHEYRAYMEENFGKEYTANLIEELRRNAKQAIKLSSLDYEKLIMDFEEKLKKLEIGDNV